MWNNIALAGASSMLHFDVPTISNITIAEYIHALLYYKSIKDFIVQ